MLSQMRLCNILPPVARKYNISSRSCCKAARGFRQKSRNVGGLSTTLALGETFPLVIIRILFSLLFHVAMVVLCQVTWSAGTCRWPSGPPILPSCESHSDPEVEEAFQGRRQCWSF